MPMARGRRERNCPIFCLELRRPGVIISERCFPGRFFHRADIVVGGRNRIFPSAPQSLRLASKAEAEQSRTSAAGGGIRRGVGHLRISGGSHRVLVRPVQHILGKPERHDNAVWWFNDLQRLMQRQCATRPVLLVEAGRNMLRWILAYVEDHHFVALQCLARFQQLVDVLARIVVQQLQALREIALQQIVADHNDHRDADVSQKAFHVCGGENGVP
mmetsp:Transcript_1314/g.3190  ORF Transcript_1314/g.3190 Transcript_1314/m.3190 type:complete len:216 (-) Transcript_1314:1341-1988(-)